MVEIIAEIGFNHDGDIEQAKKMIKAAALSNANAVKFQTFRAKDIALPNSPHYNLIQKGEMNYEQHLDLYNTAMDAGIEFISTPFSPWAVELLEKIGVSSYKVASMDCTNFHLLKYIAQTQKKIYLSTGMATLDEISNTLNFLKLNKSGPIILLHCVSMYPPEAQHLNLEIIFLLKKIFDMPTGYSDHYPGTDACLLAAILGASTIETHFTLDSSQKTGDHFHSVEPDDLKKLIEKILLFTQMRGISRSIFHKADRLFSDDYRRGVFAAKNLPKGKILKEDDFLFCRPKTIISPNDIESILGKRLLDDVSSFQPIEPSYIEG